MQLKPQVKSRSFFTFIGLSSLLGLIYLALPVGTGDTAELIEGSVNFFPCLKDTTSLSCESLERFGFTPHLISALLYRIYPNQDVVIVLWSLFSFAAYIFLVYFFYKTYYSTKTVVISNFFFIGTIFSPLIAYSVYSFSEMLLVAFSVIFLYFLYNQKFFIMLIPGILAFAYKDNIFLALVPLSIAILIASNSKKINYLYVALVALSGLAINALFNLLRYSSYLKSTYQEDGVLINGLINLNNFIALWLSPSGGILGYFYFLPLLLVVYLLKNFKDGSFREKAITSLLVLSILLTNLNLALWFSPFGWVAWGPRLFLPTIIIFIYSTFLYLKTQNLKTSFFYSTWWNYLYFAASYLMFLAAAGFLLNSKVWNSWYDRNLTDNKFCTEIPVWEINPTEFLECNQIMMWSFNSLPLNSIVEILANLGFGASVESNANYIVLPLILGVTFYFTYLLKENIKTIQSSKDFAKICEENV